MVLAGCLESRGKGRENALIEEWMEKLGGGGCFLFFCFFGGGGSFKTAAITNKGIKPKLTNNQPACHIRGTPVKIND